MTQSPTPGSPPDHQPDPLRPEPDQPHTVWDDEEEAREELTELDEEP